MWQPHARHLQTRATSIMVAARGADHCFHVEPCHRSAPPRSGALSLSDMHKFWLARAPAGACTFAPCWGRASEGHLPHHCTRGRRLGGGEGAALASPTQAPRTCHQSHSSARTPSGKRCHETWPAWQARTSPSKTMNPPRKTRTATACPITPGAEPYVAM